jgi:hypothetical protein
MLQARELPQVNIPETFLPFDVTGARLNIEKRPTLAFLKRKSRWDRPTSSASLTVIRPRIVPTLQCLAARQGSRKQKWQLVNGFSAAMMGCLRRTRSLHLPTRSALHELVSTAEFAIGCFYELACMFQSILWKPEMVRKSCRTWQQGRVW